MLLKEEIEIQLKAENKPGVVLTAAENEYTIKCRIIYPMHTEIEPPKFWVVTSIDFVHRIIECERSITLNNLLER